jgi:hypothetical protein
MRSVPARGEPFVPRRRLRAPVATPRGGAALIVPRAVPAYVSGMRVQESVMSQPPASPKPRFSRLLAVAAAAAAIVLAGTVALWARYGTAVFYETILAGIAACL